MTELKRRIVEKISSVPKAEWDRLDGAAHGGRVPYNPFVSHAYLSALEDSGSAVSRAGCTKDSGHRRCCVHASADDGGSFRGWSGSTSPAEGYRGAPAEWACSGADGSLHRDL